MRARGVSGVRSRKGAFEFCKGGVEDADVGLREEDGDPPAPGRSARSVGCRGVTAEAFARRS
jgi:hypothetical protein